MQEGKEEENAPIEQRPIDQQQVSLCRQWPGDKVFVLEEAMRPGEYMTAFEDRHGTCIINPRIYVPWRTSNASRRSASIPED
ncbi:putative protease [Erwinia amylovora]|uniref:Uncharacterized protease yegQ n=3 Tax=Erwinia amylovora TaxID=552 RepID=A0A831ERB1_ERWAM|nr:putative protease yegQ [Erwinia amylovora ACW56400]QJQ54028.1 putative protease [Erwinia amylovora]CBA21387.1 Uncharacterized protease yegQ [Erwinia amylovora CFBP1430]CBX81147.1 Uncharacterized protease yegQ [Erwinia amylovora ATCC BAA-2158]CCO79125.1 Uncharacterized protease yegQ [Erwinia amylovora Ea356]CCO82931.1 Uncharacterized protease yegQ [Erwinia amylovora Ea266]CCO86699.1 Uncharacterized protease yegQ [Erwinia amylovora CFBP 2585]CCO90488.1 Uncharacterized protease yegQ [Erwinia